MDISSALEKLGLSQTESNIYLFLLRNGPRHATHIQAALELQKVPAYRALNALKAKGCIDALGETRNQRFAARPVQTLLDKYDAQAKELAQARTSLESLVHTLANQQNELYKQNKIQIYEGVEGYRLWSEERLRGDVQVIRECGYDSFLHEFFSPEEVRGHMQRYIARRVRKGIHMRCFHHAGEPLIDYDCSDPAKLKETRSVQLPKGIAFISVFGSRFGFYTRQDGKYVGAIIDDAMLARTIEFFFDALWQHGKKI